MKNPRITAIWVAVLFLIATVASVLAALLTTLLLAGDAYLDAVALAPVGFVTAAVLMFVAAASIIAIPVVLFPILRLHSETGALLYLAARTFESVLYLLGGIFTWSLLPLAQAGQKSGTAGTEPVETLGAVLRGLADMSFNLGPAVFFSLSAIILAILFYQTRLVPRWLSVWKLLGGVLFLIQGVLILYDAATPTIEATLYLPIAINEMVLAFWLIFRGFTPSALAALSRQAPD